MQRDRVRSRTQLSGTLHRDANSPAVRTSDDGPGAGNLFPDCSPLFSCCTSRDLQLNLGVQRFQKPLVSFPQWALSAHDAGVSFRAFEAWI